MIRPDKLNELTTLKTQDLIQMLNEHGYTGDDGIRYSKFIGINRSGDFVYETTYFDESTQELETGSIFVKFDHNLLTTTADF